MRTLIGLLSRVLLACIASFGSLVACAQSQASATTGPQTGSACEKPPCAMVSCGSGPCDQSERQATLSTGKRHEPPPPLTPEQIERLKEEFRYECVFAEVVGMNEAAQREEKAGHPKIAESYGGYFAAKSGLTPEEAEIVRKIVAQYDLDKTKVAEKERATVAAVRAANAGTRMGPRNSPEIAAVQQERENLFPKVLSDILAAIGSRSFSRLDAYSLHKPGCPVVPSDLINPPASIQPKVP